MQLLQLSLLLGLLLMMAGCSSMGANNNSSTDYRAEVKYTKRMDNLPPDLKGHRQSYQVPDKRIASTADEESERQGPSILPPDSELSKQQQKQQAEKQHHHKSSKDSQANQNHTAQKTISGNRQKPNQDQELAFTTQGKNGLNKVQKALTESHYEVLRVDKTQKDIFVLDTPATDNRIDENTPLYRVHIDDDNNNHAKLKLYDEKNQLVAKAKANKFFQNLKHRL